MDKKKKLPIMQTIPGDSDLNQIFATLRLECRLCTRRIWIYLIFLLIPIIGFSFVKLSGAMSTEFLKPAFDKVLQKDNVFGKPFKFRPKALNLPMVQYGVHRVTDNIDMIPNEVLYYSSEEDSKTDALVKQFSQMNWNITYFDNHVKGFKEKKGIEFYKVSSTDEIDSKVYDSLYDEEWNKKLNHYLGGYNIKEISTSTFSYDIMYEQKLDRKEISVSVQSVLKEMKNNYTSTSSFCKFAGIVEQSFECEELMGSLLMSFINSAYIMQETKSVSRSTISHFPYNSNGFGFNSDIAGDYRAVLWLPIMFGAVLLLNVYILISDKERGYRSLMSLMGLRTRNYKISKYVTLLIFYFVYAYTLYIFGRFILSFRVFTMTSFWIWFFIFLGHGFCVTSFSFLLSTPFRSSHASMVPCLIIGFAFPRVLGMIDEQVSIKGTLNLLPLEIIFPFQFVDTTIQLLEQTVNKKVYLGVDFLFQDINIGVSLLCMYLFSIIYFVLSLYLEQILPQHGMVRKSPFFLAKKIFKCICTPCRLILCGIRKKIKKKFGDGYVNEDDEILMDNTGKELDDDVIEESRKISRMESSEVMNYGIVVDHLKKRYTRKGKLVVDNLSFRVGQDELFGLLGENGAGKTTTIKMLTGEISISGGRAHILGRDCRKDTEGIRRSIGVCPQHDILFPELSAREHLEYYAAIRGVNFWKRAKHIEKLMIQTELLEEDYLEKMEKDCSIFISCLNWFCSLKETRVSNLSAGERRRLSLAISLIGNPRAIFLDEPTTGLGPNTKRHIWTIIEKLKKNKSVILTTHSMDEADCLCDRIGIMVKGEFKCIGNQINLKNKFGQGYRLKIVYENKKRRKEVIKFVNTLVSKRSSERRITLDFAETLIWEISQKNLSISNIINSIENFKSKYGIKDWSLNQASLKDVFLYLVSDSSANKQIEDLENEIKRLKDDLVHAEKKIQEYENFDASSSDEESSTEYEESSFAEGSTDKSDFEETIENSSSYHDTSDSKDEDKVSETDQIEIIEIREKIREKFEEKIEEKIEEEEEEDKSSDNEKREKKEEKREEDEEEKKKENEEEEDKKKKKRKKKKKKKNKKREDESSEEVVDVKEPLVKQDRKKHAFPNNLPIFVIRRKVRLLFSQFFVLFRKEINLAKRNLIVTVMHIVMGSMLCIAMFVLFFFGTLSDSKEFYEPELPTALYSCQTQFDKDGCFQFIYTTNNNPFAKEVIKFMKDNYKEILDDQIKSFDTEMEMKEWIIDHPNRTVSALSFSNVTKHPMKPMIPQTEYTVYYNSTSLDQPRGDLVHIVLRLQQIVDESILNVRLGHKTRKKKIDVKLKSFPSYELKNKPAIYDVFNHYGPPFFCTMVVFVIIYATNDFVAQKSIGFHAFLKTSGLSNFPLVCSYAVFFIIFGVVDVIMVFLVGFFVGIPIVTRSNFLIFTGLFFLFFLTLLSSLTIFLPFMKQPSDVAAFISFIVFIFFYVCSLFDVDLLYATYIQTEDSWTAYVLLYFIIPVFFSPINFCKIFADLNFKAQPNFDFKEKRFEKNDGYGFSDLFKKNSHKELGLETEATVLWVGYLVINVIVYLLVGLLIHFICNSRIYNFYDYIGHRSFRPNKKKNEEDHQEFIISDDHDLTSNKNTTLIVDNIKKNYNSSMTSKLLCQKKNKVLDGVNLRIRKNELVGLLGHNSAGKTTLMNLVSGLNRITNGNIFVNQSNIKIKPSKIQKRLGIIPQYDVLIGNLTAKEHLEIFALAKSVSPSKVQNQIDNALKKVGLENFADAYAGTFSGGMKRRLSVAISMMGSNDLILADEATTGVDPYSCYKICKILYDMKKNNSILMISHDMQEAELLSDKIAILHNKKIMCFASPLELKALYDTGYTLSIMLRSFDSSDLHINQGIDIQGLNHKKVEEFNEFIEKYLSSATLKKSSFNFYIYQIDRERLSELSEATKYLEELEKQDESIASIEDKSFLHSWGINQCTLDDVYNKVTMDYKFKKAEEAEEQVIIEQVEDKDKSEESDVEMENIPLSDSSDTEEADEESNEFDEKEKKFDVSSSSGNEKKESSKSESESEFEEEEENKEEKNDSLIVFDSPNINIEDSEIKKEDSSQSQESEEKEMKKEENKIEVEKVVKFIEEKKNDNINIEDKEKSVEGDREEEILEKKEEEKISDLI